LKMRNSPKKGNSKKIITEKYAFLVEKNAAIIDTYAFKPFSPDFIKLIVRRFEEQLFKAENYWNFNLENEIHYYIKYFKTSKRYVEQLKRFLTLNGSNALDSAGGGGGFAVALALAGANVTFVDVNPSDIRLSR
jgi:Methylase of polypeptide chain release factors